MPTIAIDALGINAPGGGRSATMNILCEMLTQDTVNAYVIYLSEPEPRLAGAPGQVRQAVVPVPHRVLARLYAQSVWPFSLRRQHADVVHHMCNLVALCTPGRRVATVYDLTILLRPEIYPKRDVAYWRYLQPTLLRSVDRIVAISRTTKADLQRFYGLDDSKLAVIYPAYDPRYRPQSEDEQRRVRKVYGLAGKYMLHVGSLSRKKNLLTLLKAFEQLCTKGIDGQLVLVGRQYSKGYDSRFYEHLSRSRYKDRVVLTGAVPDGDMPGLMSAAELLVFPSLHEGFGIVPIEAMACGTPVITSSAGALVEVVGDGGMRIEDPMDACEIAICAERIITSKSVRSEWSARGLTWARRYSSAQSASDTLRLYQELLS